MGLFKSREEKIAEKKAKKAEKEIIEQRRKHEIRLECIDYLEKIIKMKSFDDIVTINLKKCNYDEMGYVLEVYTTQGIEEAYKQKKDVSFCTHYFYENEFRYEPKYCNMDYQKAYKALSLICYAEADSYGDKLGYKNFIKKDEVSVISDTLLEIVKKNVEYILEEKYINRTGMQSPEQRNTFEELYNVICSEITKRKLDEPDENNLIKQAGKRGEDEVKYALSWLPENYLLINNGEAIKLRCNIRDKEVVQEIDHIVVGTSGVFIIETKNYSGTIVIDDAGNWIRINGNRRTGCQNPLQQMERHHMVVEKIIGSEKPIYDILCISNKSAIIEGANNSKVPIVKSDMLSHYIKEHDEALDSQEVNNIANLIKNAEISETVSSFV